MIVLIVGDFGVGKDTVADLLIKESLIYHDCAKFKKILSYTTREKRSQEDNTHIFCTEEEFLLFNDLIAQTKIDDNYYGARRSQFKTNIVNLYCIDDKGVKDMLYSDIKDDILVVEVIRPKWLRNVSSDRIERVRHEQRFEYPVDYRIMNDGDCYKLKTIVHDCFDFIIKEMKKSL